MTITRRDWLIGLSGAIVSTGLPGAIPGFAATDRVVGGPAFGTYWRVSLPSNADITAVTGVIESVIVSVNNSMSPYDEHSEIARFNRARTTDLVDISPSLHIVVRESLRVAALTGGAFDPTVGPLVGRFGFGPIRGDAGGSFADIAIATGKIGKARPELTLDLCGIAKGYALDRMIDAVDGLGLDYFLIELGGEVFGRGRNWRVGIERPLPGAETIQRIVHLDGQGLATSGDQHIFFEVGGRRYGHIVDPREARPTNNAVASISVIAPTAMEADALATGLFVLGPERGAELATNHGIPALFLLRDGTGLREIFVAGFENYILV